MANLKLRQRQEYEVLHSLTHMAELKDPCEEAKPLRLGRRLAESIPECWGFVVVEIRGLAFLDNRQLVEPRPELDEQIREARIGCVRFEAVGIMRILFEA
jgi:hypothetical protein